MQKDPLERFFRLWTLKESVMKATGLGMNLPPGSFEVLPLAEGKPATILGRCWYAWEGQADPCRISVCTEEPFEKVRVSLHSEFEAGG